MTEASTANAAPAQDSAVRKLQQNASRMMGELEGLAAKLKEATAAGKDGAAAGVSDLSAQLEDLQARMKRLAEESETLTKLDKSVRAHPYMYILGALGVGLLLGKILRS